MLHYSVVTDQVNTRTLGRNSKGFYRILTTFRQINKIGRIKFLWRYAVNLVYMYICETVKHTQSILSDNDISKQELLTSIWSCFKPNATGPIWKENTWDKIWFWFVPEWLKCKPLIKYREVQVSKCHVHIGILCQTKHVIKKRKRMPFHVLNHQTSVIFGLPISNT